MINMDFTVILMILMMLPQLLGGISGFFGGNQSSAQSQQPVVNVYMNGADNDEDSTVTTKQTQGGTNYFSSDPLGGTEDNPFDLALGGAAIGAVAGAYLGAGALSWITAPIGAAIGGIGGFLVDLWWL